MTKKGLVRSGNAKTSCFRKACLIRRNTFSWLMVHCHWVFLWVRESKGLAILEKPGMNFW